MAVRGLGTGPFFRFENGKPLTRARLVEKLRDAIQTTGSDCSAYSGHSFRSGAATAAARRGIGDATIKNARRWKSNAYQLYIKRLEPSWQQSLAHWRTLPNKLKLSGINN